MPIIEPVIRPPAEAESFLLQVTTGCSANSCTFCGAYMGKPFRVKPFDEIRADIMVWAHRYPATRKVFLMDGDACVLDNKQLIPILDELNNAFPKLTRIAAYANGYNVTCRSHDELHELSSRKLSLLYLGLESGNQAVLDMCRKKATRDEMVTAVVRAGQAQIKSSVIVLLGLGGRMYSREHVNDTIIALNAMQPRYLSFLSLMLIPGTPLYAQKMQGIFEELSSHELLQEMHDIIQGLTLNKTIFRSDHASNYLSLEGRFPHDKQRILSVLHEALAGKISLRSEFLRGL